MTSRERIRGRTPAAIRQRRDAITLYVTGEGIIPAPAVTGKVTAGAGVLPLMGPPKLLIDNLPSTITYFGEAAGFVSGLMQVNAIVPGGVPRLRRFRLCFR